MTTQQVNREFLTVFSLRFTSVPAVSSFSETSNGSRSFKVTFRAARAARDAASDVIDDVTRRVMRSTVTSLNPTASERERIVDHARSARRFSRDVTFCDVIKMASNGGVVAAASNDLSRCHSDVL